jgi:hypothetical protein
MAERARDAFGSAFRGRAGDSGGSESSGNSH